MPHSLSTDSDGGGAPHHDRRLSCRATPASQSRGPVECPESSPAGLAASSQQRSRATAPVSIAHHRHHHRSLARVIARSNEPPAEPGRQSAVARRAPPSPIQEAAGSSEASVALVGTPIPIPIPTTPHHSARCARGERRPADPRPHAARSGTAVQPPPRLKTGIGARGCVAYTSSNRNNTILHGYEPVNIWPPPRIPGAGTTPSMRHSSPVSGPATALQRLRLGIRSRCKRREGDP